MRWLELLKDYNMSVLCHPRNANVVVDALNRMIIGSVSHVEEANKDLVKDVHTLDGLGVRLDDSQNGGFIVHNNFESTLVVDVKCKQYLDHLLMYLKKPVLSEFNKSFS